MENHVFDVFDGIFASLSTFLVSKRINMITSTSFRRHKMVLAGCLTTRGVFSKLVKPCKFCDILRC